jgi:transmembrane sensor
VLVLGAALLTTSGSALLAWGYWQKQPIFVQAFHTERGQQVEARLPDGSQLRLDTATRLEVLYYRQRREVRLLDGQAFFAVQPDAGRPFQVRAGPLEVTVVGTRFSVRHTPGQPGASDIRVAVEQGRVHVARHCGGSTAREAGVDLAAGQQVAADGQGRLTPPASVRTEDIAPWRSYRISFVDIPLDQALAEFERYGSTGLVLRSPGASALRLSGTFDPRDPQTFARVLPSALPVRLVPLHGQTEIVAR